MLFGRSSRAARCNLRRDESLRVADARGDWHDSDRLHRGCRSDRYRLIKFRPSGGNATGVYFSQLEMGAKRLELLRRLCRMPDA